MRPLVAVLLALSACSADPASPAFDASPSGADAGSVPGDASGAVPDATSTPPDAGSPDATPPSPDAATPRPDAGEPPDAAAASQCSQQPAGRVSLPADDSLHPSEMMEWWYWTGHLQTATGRWFGFEEVFFKTSVLSQPGRFMHAAITDVDAAGFHYVATFPAFGGYTAVPNGYSFSLGGATAVGGDGRDKLHFAVDQYVVDLDLVSTKPPVFQHGDGYTDYSMGGYTYYYSRQRMTATGTVSIGGTVTPVTGTAWFDHQYGDISRALNLGWDWFALQLDDGSEIMLFVVRSGATQVLVGGSYTDALCVTTEIEPSAFSVTPISTWQSPHTFCTWPAGWTVVVDGRTYTVTPLVDDQEVSTATPIYWEGACSVTGAATGRAYVELTGYCP